MARMDIYGWLSLIKRAVDQDLKAEDDLDSITYDQLDSISRDLVTAITSRDIVLGCRAVNRYYHMLH